jgi:glycosyltransferase involved in cell wall biosynthesis
MIELEAAPPAIRTSTRPTIAAAIITLNEQRRLPALLPRLRWLDEVIVVDGGSTDDTVAIARHFGCRVIVRPFDNFAAQRNRAMRAVRCDWVLSIDSDELPSRAVAREIRAAVLLDGFAGWRVPIRSTIFGHPFRFSGTQDDCPVRLVRRGAAVWRGSVHESLSVQGPVGKLHAWLMHDTIPDLATFLAKMRRYTSLEAESRVAGGLRPVISDLCLRPGYECLRRLVWKQGLWDGPRGWLFCLLSGWSEGVLAIKHHQLWRRHMEEPGSAA